MTLKDLASVLPGYVVMCFHTEDKAWNMTAGTVAAHEELSTAEVITAVPIQPYVVEVSIKLEEESK